VLPMKAAVPGKEGQSGMFITPYLLMSRLDLKGSCATSEGSCPGEAKSVGVVCNSVPADRSVRP
jgi:hypothetical protein